MAKSVGVTIFRRWGSPSTTSVTSMVSLTHLRPTQAARVARQRPAEEGVVEDLLHAGGREDRHHRVDEGELGVVEHGRALAGVVVAEAGDDAAVVRGAGHVGVAEDVAAAVDARALAVPEAEDALDAALAAELGLLGAPEGGGGEILVEAGLELDVGRGELASGLPHRLVDAAERRAAVAGGVAGGDEARGLVAGLLHQERADEGRDAAEEHRALARGRSGRKARRRAGSCHLPVGAEPRPWAIVGQKG